MAITIPMPRNGYRATLGAKNNQPPPDPVYALMAATQMHAEGRLYDTPPTEPPTTPKPNS